MKHPIFLPIILACTALTSLPVRGGPVISYSFDPAGSWGRGWSDYSTITLENAGNQHLDNWSLSFNMQTEVSSFDRTVEEVSRSFEGGLWSYTVAGTRSGSKLNKNKSFTFGFNAASTNYYDRPREVFVNGDGYSSARLDSPLTVPEPSYTLSARTTADWGSGANMELTLTNTGSEPLVDWVATFDMNRQILSMWNGTWSTDVVYADYAISSDNANFLAPGESAVVGFGVGPGWDNPRNLSLVTANGQNLAAVPEPGQYAAIFGTLVLMGALARRRRIRRSRANV